MPIMNANESYTRSDGTDGTVQGTGAEDSTPVYTGAYIFACAACYHGHPHSTAVHAENLLPASERPFRRCP